MHAIERAVVGGGALRCCSFGFVLPFLFFFCCFFVLFSGSLERGERGQVCGEVCSVLLCGYSEGCSGETTLC